MSSSPDTSTPKSTGTTSDGRRVIRLMASAALVAAVLAGAITALLVNIMQHKVEAQNPFYRVVAIDDTIADPATWGKNFPHAVRCLPAHDRAGIDEVRGQRGHRAQAHRRRSAHRRIPLEAG